MLNLLLADKLLGRVVATISLSQVCWHVFSPGAEISQNSVMAAGWRVGPLVEKWLQDKELQCRRKLTDYSRQYSL